MLYECYETIKFTAGGESRLLASPGTMMLSPISRESNAKWQTTERIGADYVRDYLRGNASISLHLSVLLPIKDSYEEAYASGLEHEKWCHLHPQGTIEINCGDLKEKFFGALKSVKMLPLMSDYDTPGGLAAAAIEYEISLSKSGTGKTALLEELSKMSERIQELFDQIENGAGRSPFDYIEFESGAKIISQKEEESGKVNIMLSATNIQSNAAFSGLSFTGTHVFQGFPADRIPVTVLGGLTTPLSFTQIRDKLDVPTRAEVTAGINNAFTSDVFIGGGLYVSSFGSASKGKGLCIGSNGKVIVEPNAARVVEMSEAAYKSYPIIDSKTFYLTTDTSGQHKLYLGSTLIIADNPITQS